MARLRLVHDIAAPVQGPAPHRPADRGVIPVDPDRFPCFAADTIIATDQEDLPIQHLKPGDRVLAPDTGFDLVLRSLRLPMDLSAQAPCRVFAARSAGNFADLHVSRACQVFSAGMEALHTCRGAGARPAGSMPVQGPVRLFCLILQKGRLVVANGALASVANAADLARHAPPSSHQRF